MKSNLFLVLLLFMHVQAFPQTNYSINDWIRKAEAFEEISEMESARNCYIQAIKLCHSKTPNRIVYEVRKKYADFLSDIDDDMQAAINYETAAKYCRLYEGESMNYANACYSAAHSYSIINNDSKSKSLMEKALLVYSKLLPESIIKYTQTLIWLYEKDTAQQTNYNKKLSEAIDLLKEHQRKNMNKPFIMAEAWNAIAKIYFTLLRFDESEDYYNKTVSLIDSLDSKYNNDPNSRLTRKNNKAAKYLYYIATSGINECRTKKGERTNPYSAIHKIYTTTIEELIKEYNEGICLAGDKNPYVTSILAEIADSCFSQGELDKAVEYYELYEQKHPLSLLNSFLLSSTSERFSLWEEHKDGFDSIQSKTCTLLKNGTVIQRHNMSNLAYNSALFSKGILLSTSVEFSQIIKKIDRQDVTNMYQQGLFLKEEIAELHEKYNESIAGINSNILDSIVQKNDEFSALNQKLTTIISDYGYDLKSLETKWNDIQKQLKPDEIAIEFCIVGEDEDQQILAHMIKREWKGVISVALLAQKEVFVTEGLDVDEAIDIQLSDLNQNFWDMLDSQIKDVSTIYFSLDKFLHKLPIEYLPYGKTRLPLAMQKKVYRLSSTRELTRKYNIREGTAVLFGDIDYYTKKKLKESRPRHEALMQLRSCHTQKMR